MRATWSTANDGQLRLGIRVRRTTTDDKLGLDLEVAAQLPNAERSLI
jgi:hypothetical protein